ncbi:MAG TPA: ComEC/Rec2 family competence protein, partial [Chitinophagaceae bacterium]|nr:ComEC/Rec2 family competence protein [Chitinophagaceae bacterium]
MSVHAVSIWKKAPFIRLLLSLGVGIILQWNFIIPVIFHWLILLVGSLITLLFFWLPVFKRFKLGYLMGVAVCLVFVAIGSLLIAYNDIRYQKDWFNNHYRGNEFLLLKLEEPLVEKPRSFKAVASVLSLFNLKKNLKVRGRIIVYFSKDSVPHKFGYGSLLLIRKPLQEIRSSGNPGAFDFKRFALFQGITHQVYLMPGEFIRPDSTRKSILKEFIFDTRRMILNILKKNIRGKKELGLAEALLIGYKDDLDKTLLQSYSNTGVVHVIAISGLHLGLIYWLLLRLCQPLLGNRKTRWLNPTIIITGLWLFTLIAGAQPSVLRSAIMFTCLVLGNSFTRKSTAINSLAFSAFLLLCINPFWLFDIGFQLSYAAVLSLIIFMRPVYNLFYIRQKIIDYIWQMNAVTLAAQLITLPFSIYYFHQFPNFFLLTNLIAVPLSSLVLLVEIGLCLFHWLPGLASFIGELLGKMIGWMNFFIEWMEKIPFSLWDGLHITIVQMFLMLVFLAGLHNWFVEKSKPGLKLALWALLGFAGLRLVSFCEASQQQ